MKRTVVVVPWQEGLHLRRATRLVRLAQRFRSHILLRVGAKVANARSILSVLTLCAAIGSALEIEALGDDESEAVTALEAAFTPDRSDDVQSSSPSDPR